jgi:hypothetical protein
MQEHTRAAFEQALTEAEARELEAERRVVERRRFEEDFRKIRDGDLVPALKEIATELLEPRGWTCEVQVEEVAVRLKVYRDYVFSHRGGDVDQLYRFALIDIDRFLASSSTHRQGEGQKDRTISLS